MLDSRISVAHAVDGEEVLFLDGCLPLVYFIYNFQATSLSRAFIKRGSKYGGVKKVGL